MNDDEPLNLNYYQLKQLNHRMKKIFKLISHLIILILIIIIGFLIPKNIEMNKNLNSTSQITSSTPKTYTELYVNYIDIQPFLIKKFCEAATGEINSTWDYFDQRNSAPNINNNDYICYFKDQVSTKDLFTKKFDSKKITHTPETICSKIFNQEFFRGIATDDQYSCTLIPK